jgi:hypothetical protein
MRSKQDILKFLTAAHEIVKPKPHLCLCYLPFENGIDLTQPFRDAAQAENEK